ncbi:MAG: hypothetical protein KC442_14325 [Thermomicrobiales bacterium]|nr:hypothetical protein [Thermomicrobiales bacterium]
MPTPVGGGGVAPNRHTRDLLVRIRAGRLAQVVDRETDGDMARIVMTLAEWRAIAHELQGVHHDVAPAGLRERLQALLVQTPPAWQDQPYAIELDESSIEAVWAIHAIVTGRGPLAGDQSDGVTAAMLIIQNHQRRSGDTPPPSEEPS